jgi:hypothetical protein
MYKPSRQQLGSLIDMIVEAIVRELEEGATPPGDGRWLALAPDALRAALDAALAAWARAERLASGLYGGRRSIRAPGQFRRAGQIVRRSFDHRRRAGEGRNHSVDSLREGAALRAIYGEGSVEGADDLTPRAGPIGRIVHERVRTCT